MLSDCRLLPAGPGPGAWWRSRRRRLRPALPLARLVVVLVAILPGLAGGARAEDYYEDITYDPKLYGPERPLEAIVQEAGLTLDQGAYLPQARVEVIKSSYQLKLYSGEKLLKTYRIQLGKRPRGTKTRKNDSRTPDGTYRICGHNRGSRYYLSLQLNYPNEADVDQALGQKRINAAQAQSLKDALAAGDCPCGRTRLGGEIFIHGQWPPITRQLRREKRKPSARTDLQAGDLDPGRMRQFYNWTSGCIGMANPDIRDLFKFLPNGTTVEIRE